MNCYFDGSVGGKSDEWLTLGGLVATDAIWAEFQKQWEAMLKERYPIAPYVHMTDLITGNDPFERIVGWTDCKVDRLVSDVVNLLRSIDGTKMCAFACAVDVKARQRLIDEGYEITDPAVICAEIGLAALLRWYVDRHGLEMAHLFYDQNEPFIRSIRQRGLAATKKKKSGITPLFWGNIANVQPVRMDDTPAIQAADVIAWAFTRRLRNMPEDRWSNLATRLIGNRHRRGILANTQVDPITEDILRAKYRKRSS